MGRPLGSKNKATGDLQKLARQYTAEALATLRRVCSNRKAPAAAQVMAARALLDRGYGMPAQALTGEDGVGPAVINVHHHYE